MPCHCLPYFCCNIPRQAIQPSSTFTNHSIAVVRAVVALLLLAVELQFRYRSPMTIVSSDTLANNALFLSLMHVPKSQSVKATKWSACSAHVLPAKCFRSCPGSLSSAATIGMLGPATLHMRKSAVSMSNRELGLTCYCRHRRHYLPLQQCWVGQSARQHLAL